MRLPVIPFGSRVLKKQKPLLKGSDVRHLQQALKRLEVFNARIDGVFGYETMQAVREFQRAYHIKQSGIVDDDEFEILKELMRCGINKWRTIQRDYRHSGYSPVPIPKQLKISWIRPIPDIIGLNCSADRLIVTTRREVLAIDLKSGERLWKSSELFPESSSTIFEGHVIVPTGSLTILGFYSGKILKTLKQDNFILPAAANKTQIYAPSSGSLYCFNQSGDMKWNYKTYGAYITSPAIGYDFVYFASYDRCIYCLDEKGILCWKTKISDIIQIPPAIWDGKVFTISCDSWVSALNPLVGEIIWRKKITDEEFMMPAFHQDFMLLANYRGEVTALSFQRAEVIWVIDLPDAPTTLPIVCPNTFFIGTESGLMAYDIKTLDAKMHLEGKKITAIVPGAMSLFAATQQELIKLSPE